MTAAQLAFYVPGLTCSIVGTVLWAWNDFGAWIAAFITRAARRFWGRLRPRLVRLGLLHGHVYLDAGTATATAGGYGELVTSPGDEASLDEKIAFLLEQNRQHQVKFQRLERQLRTEITDSAEGLRHDFDARIAHEIEQLRTERVGLRRAGVALVMIGIVLLAVYPFA